MTKRQLIDEIITVNRTAQPGFLARFEAADLDEYLRHLLHARTRRISGDSSRYSKFFRGQLQRPAGKAPMKLEVPAPMPAAEPIVQAQVAPLIQAQIESTPAPVETAVLPVEPVVADAPLAITSQAAAAQVVSPIAAEAVSPDSTVENVPTVIAVGPPTEAVWDEVDDRQDDFDGERADIDHDSELDCDSLEEHTEATPAALEHATVASGDAGQGDAPQGDQAKKWLF